ncbi:MAG: hypothetical protein Q7R65_01545 [bacterium]|nr:hypothetical protein [bacterium]
MADGIKCKHCGRYEATHDVGDDGEPELVLPGYETSFAKCDGYKPENPVLAQKLAEENRREAYLIAMRVAGAKLQGDI